jgi:hypothetical protein
VDEFVVQNLNRTPRLPYADQTFDGAVCTVSVQYLSRSYHGLHRCAARPEA